MSDEQILKAAIEKAKVNSFPTEAWYSHWATVDEKILTNWCLDVTIEGNKYMGIIFDHDFAKAFWGEKLLCCGCGTGDDLSGFACYFTKGTHEAGTFHIRGAQYDHKPAWQYHLQQMVLEEKPLKYLEKFLNQTGEEV